MTEPSARSAATATAPLNGEPSIREVFLSPRVIDREAFNDYSASLRRLIEQAGGQAEALRSAAGEADQARTALRELTGKHQAKFDLAARLVQTLDQRASEAEKLLQAARDAAGTLDALRTDADRALAEHAQRLDARVHEAAEQTRQRLEAMETQAQARLLELERAAHTRAEAATQALQAAIAAGEARVRDAAQRAADDLAASEARADQAVASFASRLAETEAALERALVAAEDRLRAAGERTATQTDAGEARLTATADRLLADLAARQTATATAMHASAEHAGKQVREEQRRLHDLIHRVEALATETESLIGLPDGHAPGTPPAPGSLAAMLEEAATVRNQTERTLADLTAARAGTDEAARAFDQTIQHGRSELERLTGMAGQLSASAETAAAACERADAALRERVRAVDEVLTRPTAELHAQAETLKAGLEAILTRAERSRQASESVMSDAWALFQALDKQLQELRPWRPVLLDESGAERAIPAPIQALLDQVRGELSRDLSVLAAGMYQIAVKAQKAGAALEPARS